MHGRCRGTGGRERAGEARQVPVCGKFSATPRQGEPGSRCPLFGGSSLLCTRILHIKPTLLSFMAMFCFLVFSPLMFCFIGRLKSSFLHTPKLRFLLEKKKGSKAMV